MILIRNYNGITFSLVLITLLIIISGCSSNPKETIKPEISVNERPNFVQDIAPIIYQNCSHCHSETNIAPFPLTEFKHIYQRKEQILFSLESSNMPPWKPDTTYSSFKFVGQPKISKKDIITFKKWIDNNAILGDSIFNNKYSQIKTKENPSNAVKCRTNREFVHPGNGKDNYEALQLEIDICDTLFTNKIELVNQNKKIMHHAWVISMPAQMSLSELSRDIFMDRRAFLLTGFLPNMTKSHLPEGYVKHIYPGTKLLMNVHYGPTWNKETDQPEILIHKSESDNNKLVQLLPIIEDSLVNKEFCIAAGIVDSFLLKHTLDYDVELISITPHMHYRGKKFISFGVYNNDTIPLIKINDWDFDWQNIYYLTKPYYLKKGTEIFVKGIFDNRASNPDNPVIPPENIRFGDRTIDEMLEMILEVHILN